MTGNPIILEHGRHEAAVAPALGGSILYFRSAVETRVVDWLRPTANASIVAGDPLGTACFPLVPYSNRIRGGRFVFEGRNIELPPNFGDHPHSIHGVGWQAPWRVVEASAGTLVLEYRHQADAWPFDFSARQHFALNDSGLAVTVELVNEGEARMPAGIGLHPYFPRTPMTRVQANAEEMWRVDDEVMPVERVMPPRDRDPNAGIAADKVALDNVFSGWDGTAVIEWPERRASLKIAADEAFGFFVLFTPPGEDFLCVEPVSHVTDAFNMAEAGAADTGMRVLDPGESLVGTIRFSPEFE